MSLFHTLVERWSPGSTAISYGDAVVTYAELEDRSRRAAQWLIDQGVQPGDVVALHLAKSLLFLEVHLGALAMGAITLPIHTHATESEREALLADSGATLLVHDPAVGERIAESAPASPNPVDPEAIAVLCYTSGTTGQPKGARIRHRNLLASIRALHEAWHWSADDVLVHALPLFHIHGLFVAQHGALFAGAESRWLGRFHYSAPQAGLRGRHPAALTTESSPGTTLHQLGRKRLFESTEGVTARGFDARAALDAMEDATVFMGVPTFYTRLLAEGPGERDFSHMRLFTSGSAPLRASVHQQFEASFGHRILERYGMTEVGIVLSNPYAGERRPGAVGFPLPGVEAKVTGEADEELPAGTIGEIRIRGACVFAGYLNRPDATEAAIGDGWMHTGDLGFVDDDGYFHIVGRAKDMVISGGLNVYPREIEAVLAVAPEIREVAVFGLPDDDLGEQVVAAVVCDAWAPERWEATVRDRLNAYKLPRRWFRVASLPRNAMGKVQKSRLRERFANQTAVRRAVLGDVPSLARGNRLMALETEDHVLEPDTIARGVRNALEGDHARYWVAEVDGGYAGQAMVTTEWSDWRNGPLWWLQSVYVEPKHRRRGVFRSLYTQIEDEARAAGAVGLRLYVEKSNQSAQQTYAALGMAATGYLVFESLFEEGR